MPSLKLIPQYEIEEDIPTFKKIAQKTKIRVFLTEDHPLIRVGIAAVVGQEPDMEVCGEASNIDQTMKLIERSQPDVVCVDITLAGESGIDLVRRIHSQYPSMGILIYSMHEDELQRNRARQAGAKAYVRKMEEPAVLIQTIRSLMQG